MGKAKIKEHLGEAHYRIALDIDIAYAKKQVEALLLEIEARKVKLEEYKQKRDDLKLAFDAAGVALKDYLAPLQAESEAAYATMQAAYEAWLYAVQNEPDPSQISDAQQDMSDAAKAFFDAHAALIAFWDVEPEIYEGPDWPELVQIRADKESLLGAAQSTWAGARGPSLDPDGVAAASDAMFAAIVEFDNATATYVAIITMQEAGDLAVAESAMDYYETAFQDARTDWIKAVTDSTASNATKTLKDQYDAATAAFETAQKAMSATLNDGSMPPGLAEKYQAMLEAETRWRVADQDYRALLIAQALPTKQMQYLSAKLRGFVTDITVDGNGNVSGGEPIDQPANAWCVDYSEELPVGTEVATIEIPGERDIGVRIRPGYENRYTYTASRDGKLQPSWSSSPEATFFNWAVHPGANKWKPNYRLGEIMFIDPVTEKCTVQLDEQKNNARSKGYDWLSKTLDMNNIVRTIIDPETGSQTTIMPGPNIQVSDGIVTLTDVTIEYMECNAAVFEVGDHVMVEFTDRSWLTPKVIGFAENPRPCQMRAHGIAMTPSTNLSPLGFGIPLIAGGDTWGRSGVDYPDDYVPPVTYPSGGRAWQTGFLTHSANGSLVAAPPKTEHGEVWAKTLRAKPERTQDRNGFFSDIVYGGTVGVTVYVGPEDAPTDTLVFSVKGTRMIWGLTSPTPSRIYLGGKPFSAKRDFFGTEADITDAIAIGVQGNKLIAICDVSNEITIYSATIGAKRPKSLLFEKRGVVLQSYLYNMFGRPNFLFNKSGTRCSAVIGIWQGGRYDATVVHVDFDNDGNPTETVIENSPSSGDYNGGDYYEVRPVACGYDDDEFLLATYELTRTSWIGSIETVLSGTSYQLESDNESAYKINGATKSSIKTVSRAGFTEITADAIYGSSNYVAGDIPLGKGAIVLYWADLKNKNIYTTKKFFEYPNLTQNYTFALYKDNILMYDIT
jgi:hypothetical protein